VTCDLSTHVKFIELFLILLFGKDQIFIFVPDNSLFFFETEAFVPFLFLLVLMIFDFPFETPVVTSKQAFQHWKCKLAEVRRKDVQCKGYTYLTTYVSKPVGCEVVVITLKNWDETKEIKTIFR